MDLIILDYSDGSVHYHTIDDNTEVDNFFIDGFGYRAKDCHYMCGDSIITYLHNSNLEIVKV